MKTAVRIRINSIGSSRGRSEASFSSKDVIKDIESFKYNHGTDVVAAVPNSTASGVLACRAWACARRDRGASPTMSCPARRTRGMEGIAECTRIKSRKLQSCKIKSRKPNANKTQTSDTIKEHKKKKQKKNQQKKRDDMSNELITWISGIVKRFPHCGHICRLLKGLWRCAFCLGPVTLFGAGAGFGGRDFDPSGVDVDGDEVSLVVEGITVPGLKFREKVEDFWGADNGGATTTIFWEEERVDTIGSGCLFERTRWSPTEGTEGKTNEGTFVKVLDWLVERAWRESTAVEEEEEAGKDDVDNDNWLRECCFAIDAGAFLSW